MTIETTALDEKTLEQLTEDLGRARADELLRDFAVLAEQRVISIETAAERSDLDGLMFEGHALKGSAVSYGALAVARAADRMVAACRAGDIETALNRAAALPDLVMAAVAACNARVSDSK